MEEFNKELFKTKAGNIFVKICIALMGDTLDEIKHFMSDSLYLELTNYLHQLHEKGQQQMYDEVNVEDVFVKSHEVVGDKEVVEANLIARYMKYIIDIESGKVVEGKNIIRIRENYKMIFEKKVATKELGLVRKCPNCGASMDINASGKCQFCGSTFDLYNYDYILVSMEKI